AGGVAVVVATVQVAAHLPGVAQSEVVAALGQRRACAAPVAEHPGRVAVQEGGGLQAAGQGAGGQACQQGRGGGGQMMELMHEIALSFDCWKNGKLPEMQASSRARQ